jgi:predicted PurR-regulated permease PerM
MESNTNIIMARRIILALLLGGLALLGYAVLQMFIVPVAWAAIVAYSTWPLYTRLRAKLAPRENLASLLMTLALAAAFVLPVLWLVVMLRAEMAGAYSTLTEYLARGPDALPGAVRRIPWLGSWLQDTLGELSSNPDGLREQVSRWLEQGTGELLGVLGGVGRNAAKLAFALVTVFFFYRDGEKLLDQLKRVLRSFIGFRFNGYLDAVSSTTKAVVYGLVLTALAQGLLAGLGYWAAGVNAPALLGAVTVVLALIPFGTPVVWGAAGIWLLLKGETAAGIGLLAWGTFVVSWVDNLIRPIVISSATQIPFLLVMFGVLGGLAAFGLIGLFVGPVILAVLTAVWREWLEGAQIPENIIVNPVAVPPTLKTSGE